MTKEEKQVELINEIIFLETRLNELNQFHPDNPDRIDVLKETLELKNMISNLKDTFDSLDE